MNVKKCAHCKTEFYGRSNRKYCQPKCRKAAWADKAGWTWSPNHKTPAITERDRRIATRIDAIYTLVHTLAVEHGVLRIDKDNNLHLQCAQPKKASRNLKRQIYDLNKTKIFDH